MLDIVANQIVEQIEAEKNGQERAHASTQLSMALNLIFAIRCDLPVEDTEVTKVDKRAASFVARQTQDKNAMGNECFRQRILFIFLSTLFIHFSAFSQAACVKRAVNHKPIK